MVSPRVWKGIDGHSWCQSRIVWMTGKIGMVKCALVCAYAPVNEKGIKGKMRLEKFWEDLGQLLKKFENVKVFVFGDMNARVGSTEIGGVVGKYVVDGVNENGQYLVDICAEMGLLLSNTFFQHKMIHRYTWARGNNRSLIDYIAVDNRLRREVEDAKVVIGLFSGLDHFAVVAQVRMRERWGFKGNKKKGERRELASERLHNSKDSQRYERNLEQLLSRARIGMEDNACVCKYVRIQRRLRVTVLWRPRHCQKVACDHLQGTTMGPCMSPRQFCLYIQVTATVCAESQLQSSLGSCTWVAWSQSQLTVRPSEGRVAALHPPPHNMQLFLR